MRIAVVGLNHKTAPVELREKMSIDDVELDDVLKQLRETRTILESVVVSTCNRTEIYALVSSVRAGDDFLKTFLAKRSGLSLDEIASHLYMYQGEQAVRHLMKVTCGLDSLVIGETQILGQVRSAYLTASDTGNTGALFNQLFRKAIQVGKKAQTDTSIGQNAVSVSYAAVQLARKIFGDLHDKGVLIVGAGKMSQLTAQHLKANGIHRVAIVNRTASKAQALAEQFDGVALPWEQLETALNDADIVISSTGSKEIVLHASTIAKAMKRRSGRPMALIDIAVPRDIDPEASKFSNVFLYDIDDLEGVVAANLAERERQAEFVEEMVQQALLEYSQWLSEQEVVPLITAIRDKGTKIQESVMESLRRKLPNLTDRELQLIQKHTMSIVNQLLREPIQNMKELAIASGGSKHVHVFAELFGITEENLSVNQGVLLGMPSRNVHENRLPSNGFVDLVRLWTEALQRDDDEGKRSGLHPVLR